MAGLWTLFESKVCSNRELLRLVLCFLDAEHARNLRRANRRLREAVSAAVDQVTYTLQHGRLWADLATVFPSAARLVLRAAPILGDETAIKSHDVFLFLQHVVDLNPALLQQLAHLTVELVPEGKLSDNGNRALGRLLSRCTQLQDLEVTLLDHSAHRRGFEPCRMHFAGRGSTPEERRTAMQQQLQSITLSNSFLAPDSWPGHQCLTLLQLIAPSSPWLEFGKLYSSGMATASLADLNVQASSRAQVGLCAGLRQLTNLQCLSLYAGGRSPDDPDGPLDEVVAEVACLTTLQVLSTDNSVLGSREDCSIPRSWSQLACLASLTLYECHLHLATLPSLPSLQLLDLARCTMVGHLTQLSVWPALASLRWDSESALREAQGDPQEAAAAAGGGALPDGNNLTDAEAPLQAWRGSMRDLAWKFSWRDMQTITQLTALTRLHLMEAVVSPEVCWQLASLPKLEQLELPRGHAAPARPSTGATSAFRPAFPSLKYLEVGTWAGLLEMAYWSDTNPSMVLGSDGILNSDGLILYDKLGAGWLAAMMAAAGGGSLLLGVGSDSALARLRQALEHLPDRSKTERLRLVLGRNLSHDALALLFKAADTFPGGRLHVANGLECSEAGLTADVLRMGGEVPRQSFWRLQGVAAPGLRALHIDSCIWLQDCHVAFLAAAAPKLQRLRLEKAAKVSGKACCALLCCQQLEEVHIVGSTLLDGPAAAMLLECLGKLQRLTIGSLASQDVARELPLRGALGDVQCPSMQDRWVLADVGRGAVGCSRRG